jgi:PKD repeat protein
MTYTWDFGDGGSGSGAVVTHLFPVTATLQTYTVTLTAANACSSPQVMKAIAILPQYIYLPLIMRQ